MGSWSNGGTAAGLDASEIDREHAAGAWEIAHVKLAAVRFDAATADGQPQTEARSRSAELLERSEDLLRFPFRETAAFVLDTDQDAIGLCVRGEGHATVRPGELDGVLQDV